MIGSPRSQLSRSASYLGTKKGRFRPRRFPGEAVEVVVRTRRLVEHLAHHGGQQSASQADPSPRSPSRLFKEYRTQRDTHRRFVFHNSRSKSWSSGGTCLWPENSKVDVHPGRTLGIRTTGDYHSWSKQLLKANTRKVGRCKQ